MENEDRFYRVIITFIFIKLLIINKDKGDDNSIKSVFIFHHITLDSFVMYLIYLSLEIWLDACN